MTKALSRLNYVEIPVTDSAVSSELFAAAFGWKRTAFGPTYAATTQGGAGDNVDFGLQAVSSEATMAPLAGIQADDLDATLARVRAAGGTVARAAFDFPGGRRFHFREPGGNELAAWTLSDGGSDPAPE